MTPDEFIAKWQASERPEQAAAQEHFIDLCHMLDEPTPNSDPTGGEYAFEKGATKATGGQGSADVWKRGCFAWEYKGKDKDLDAAFRQLQLYAGALENPPLLVVSDLQRIVVRTNWTNAVSERQEFTLDDLREPLRRRLLKALWSNPEAYRPHKTRTALTEEAAAKFRRDRAAAAGPRTRRANGCAFRQSLGVLPVRRRCRHAASRPVRGGAEGL